MSDARRLIYYGVGTAVAIILVGASIWYYCQEEECKYEEAKEEIAGMRRAIYTEKHPSFGEIIELEAFLELTTIIKNEKLRKRTEQLAKQGLAPDHPTEERRRLFRVASSSGEWGGYDKFVVKHEAAEEAIASRTVKDIAALAGVSE